MYLFGSLLDYNTSKFFQYSIKNSMCYKSRGAYNSTILVELFAKPRESILIATDQSTSRTPIRSQVRTLKDAIQGKVKVA